MSQDAFNPENSAGTALYLTILKLRLRHETAFLYDHFYFYWLKSSSEFPVQSYLQKLEEPGTRGIGNWRNWRNWELEEVEELEELEELAEL